MQRTIVLHKIQNLNKENFFEIRPGCANEKILKKDFYNYELTWLKAAELTIKNDPELVELYTYVTDPIKKLGYSSLGQLVIKNFVLKKISEGESYYQVEIKFIFDQRTMKPETREKINLFIHLLLHKMSLNGYIKKEFAQHRVA